MGMGARIITSDLDVRDILFKMSCNHDNRRRDPERTEMADETHRSGNCYAE